MKIFTILLFINLSVFAEQRFPLKVEGEVGYIPSFTDCRILFEYDGVEQTFCSGSVQNNYFKTAFHCIYQITRKSSDKNHSDYNKIQMTNLSEKTPKPIIRCGTRDKYIQLSIEWISGRFKLKVLQTVNDIVKKESPYITLYRDLFKRIKANDFIFFPIQSESFHNIQTQAEIQDYINARISQQSELPNCSQFHSESITPINCKVYSYGQHDMHHNSKDSNIGKQQYFDFTLKNDDQNKDRFKIQSENNGTTYVLKREFLQSKYLKLYYGIGDSGSTLRCQYQDRDINISTLSIELNQKFKEQSCTLDFERKLPVNPSTISLPANLKTTKACNSPEQNLPSIQDAPKIPLGKTKN